MGNHATVLNHCVVTNTVIGDRCSVGPFAHLRPESLLGEGARVGNFVELKKTSLGAGAKANHLAYLGDAVIGENSNIGAGHDHLQLRRHRETPDHDRPGTFVGSNSTLVAPVTIGDGSYVAAGSAITEDVPADALGIGRSRQENKPGWVAGERAVKSEK